MSRRVLAAWTALALVMVSVLGWIVMQVPDEPAVHPVRPLEVLPASVAMALNKTSGGDWSNCRWHAPRPRGQIVVLVCPQH